MGTEWHLGQHTESSIRFSGKKVVGVLRALQMMVLACNIKISSLMEVSNTHTHTLTHAFTDSTTLLREKHATVI